MGFYAMFDWQGLRRFLLLLCKSSINEVGGGGCQRILDALDNITQKVISFGTRQKLFIVIPIDTF